MMDAALQRGLADHQVLIVVTHERFEKLHLLLKMKEKEDLNARRNLSAIVTRHLGYLCDGAREDSGLKTTHQAGHTCTAQSGRMQGGAVRLP